jgi:hypothetical protein
MYSPNSDRSTAPNPGTGAWPLSTGPGCLLALFGLLLIQLALASPVAHAAGCVASKEYTGPENGSWEEANNWSGKALPTSAEAVCIPAGKGTITVPTKTSAQAKRLEAHSAIMVEHEGTLAIAENLEGQANDSTFSGLNIQGTLTNAGSWFYLSGENVIDGEITTGKFGTAFIELLSGTLSGEGKVGVAFANAGTIEPGGAGVVGELHFVNFAMRKTGTLTLDLESASKYDQLGGFTAGSGSYFLIGTINVNLLGGYKPALNTRWEFIHEVSATNIFPEETTFVPANFTAEQGPFEFFLEQLPPPPVVVTEAASAFGASTATLNGLVTPNGFPAFNCEFEYGTTTSYNHEINCSPLGTTGYSPAATTALISGLNPSTTYHFRLWAQTEHGRTNGLDRTFTTLPAEEPVGKSEEKTTVEEKPSSPPGGSNTTGGATGNTALVSNIPGGGSSSTTQVVAVATAPVAVEELLLGCTKRSLVLNDVLISGGHVALNGSAAKGLQGKKIKLLFDDKKQVATAVVMPDGQFSATAPLPPAALRNSNTARYIAVSGSQRSLNLKLTRRLVLQPPIFTASTVTLVGEVQTPLTKPVSTVTVEQQLECGKTSRVITFTPPANGRFHVTVSGIPTNAKAGIYRLTTNVLQNPKSHHPFPTFSLPLPIALG